MGKSVLMNKNRKVMLVDFDEKVCQFVKVFNYYNIEYAPFSIYQSIKKGMDENEIIKSMNQWYGSRMIPDYRDSKDEILKCYDTTCEELAAKHYILSLSDQYWLKPEDENINWDDINYFYNDYDGKTFFEATYGNDTFSSLNIATSDSNKYETPNNTLGGQLKKAWVKINGSNYLFKGAGSLFAYEPINEYIASKVCDILDVPHVNYSVLKIHSKRHETLVSVCQCLINENEEIIPAYQVLKEADFLNHNPNDVWIYIDILKNHGIKDAEKMIEEMILLDYIMLNEDRHLNNFGVIRNVETLEWKGVCPIYDTGKSLNCNVTEEYWDFKKGEVKLFSKGFIPSETLLNYLETPLQKQQIDKLKSLSFELNKQLYKYQRCIKLFDDQIDKISQGFLQRVELLNDFLYQHNMIVDSNELQMDDDIIDDFQI